LQNLMHQSTRPAPQLSASRAVDQSHGEYLVDAGKLVPYSSVIALVIEFSYTVRGFSLIKCFLSYFLFHPFPPPALSLVNLSIHLFSSPWFQTVMRRLLWLLTSISFWRC
jgi:hypothetical protein